MFFKKRNSRKEPCPNCNEEIQKKFSFCPYCGSSLIDETEEQQDYGLLGKSDSEPKNQISSQDMIFSEKMFNSIFTTLLKSLDTQFKEIERTGIPEERQLPNGIKIRIGMAQPKKNNSKISSSNSLNEEQAKKMANLPRASAKTKVRRLSDKIVYELAAPGIQSTQDIFVSKLESGYEIKAIGKNKIYVNSLPVNLPLKKYSIGEKGITVEFGLE